MSDISVVEEIANAICDVRDNVMAMEFTKCIGELLKKNGVTPMISDYTSFSPGLSEFEIKCGVTIDGLDFSEHDKLLEDKIAELKKDYKTASELLGKYQQENESLKQHIAGLESENEVLKCSIDKMASSKSEWIDKAVEWQQKCEKLESNEKEKRTKINLNDLIKVKLTPLGAEIYYHQYDELNKKIKENGGTQLEPRMPKIDNDGYTEFQLHHFISLYGEHIGMCKPNVIEPINIVLVE